MDGVAEIRHQIFCAGPTSLFVWNTFCKALIGFPLRPRELAEVVHFKAKLASARKVPVVVNLRNDQDTTTFQVCAVGSDPPAKAQSRVVSKSANLNSFCSETARS